MSNVYFIDNKANTYLHLVGSAEQLQQLGEQLLMVAKYGKEDQDRDRLRYFALSVKKGDD